MFNGSAVELVDHFKYLGVVFKYTGSFAECKVQVKEKATRAMFALLSKGRRLQIPVDIMMEMFDRTIVPILLYGCEVWGCDNVDILETVHLKFCKYLLGLKASTPSCMVYGELGRLPLKFYINNRIISYWVKIVSDKYAKINKLMYNTLYQLYERNDYRNRWISYIHDLLFENGPGYIWIGQNDVLDPSYVRSVFKDRYKAHLV